MKNFRFFFIVLFLGCSSQKIVVNKKSDLVEFNNPQRLGARADGAVIQDKDFKLLIPQGLLRRESTVSNYFFTRLDFDRDQKIILLNIPGYKTSINKKFLNLSIKNFQRLCEDENIADILKDIVLFKHRKFGLSRIGNGEFYTIYLNVFPNRVDLFNYSIESTQIK